MGEISSACNILVGKPESKDLNVDTRIILV
jgi:hypothetical protein